MKIAFAFWPVMRGVCAYDGFCVKVMVPEKEWDVQPFVNDDVVHHKIGKTVERYAYGNKNHWHGGCCKTGNHQQNGR